MSKNMAFLDIARGLAAVFMVCVHVLGLYSQPSVISESYFGKIISLLGEAPAAPVFMLIMGVLFSYKAARNIKTDLQRGIKLFIKGYLLNVARLITPLLIMLVLFPFVRSTMLTQDNPDVVTELINNLLVVDILQLAGLSYLIMALLSHWQVNNTLIYMLIMLIVIISPQLWGVGSSMPVMNLFMAPLWGDKGELVSFPLFPWLIYPLLGFILGRYYFNAKADLTEVIKKQLIMGLTLFIIGLWIASSNYSYHFGDYWRTGPAGLIAYSGFTLAWLALLWYLTPFIHYNIVGLLSFMSHNITNFYIVQWLLISAGVVILNGSKLSILPTSLAMILVTLLTLLICQWLHKKSISL